ncbi:DMT family transporter [Legionella worsleiensis]|uniref:Integral membrane protein n=1 Tax=Legionella worsleiensis TaxID=45076 RepID=A0A0W1A6C5_9GAMM|nr:DMT family transporter [Legionella worsleiensis]KTD76808.1 integral membrane protein [Legionella worsleiensis]STY30657.1 permease, DMT superfamily [Legionella worsleiensis]
MKSQEKKGSLYAILSGFLYGFIGYFGLSAMNGKLSAETMLFWRFFIASGLILIIIIPQIKQVKNSFLSLFTAFIGGALYYGFSTLLYFYSSLYIGSGLAMVIFFTYPVMIMFLNFILYGHTMPRIYYLAAFIILMGMLLMIDLGDVAFDIAGIGLGVVSAFFYACYLISSKRNILPPVFSTLMVCLGCMMTCLLMALWNHTFAFPASATVWGNLLGIGVIATVIPVLLMLLSLQYISSEKASLLSVLEPVFVVIFGVLFLGEEIRPWHALGIILVLSGALITLYSHRINLGQFKQWLLRITRA